MTLEQSGGSRLHGPASPRHVGGDALRSHVRDHVTRSLEVTRPVRSAPHSVPGTRPTVSLAALALKAGGELTPAAAWRGWSPGWSWVRAGRTQACWFWTCSVWSTRGEMFRLLCVRCSAGPGHVPRGALKPPTHHRAFVCCAVARGLRTSRRSRVVHVEFGLFLGLAPRTSVLPAAGCSSQRPRDREGTQGTLLRWAARL